MSNVSADELHSNAQIQFIGASIPIEPNDDVHDSSGIFINGPANYNQNDKCFGYVAENHVVSTMPKLPNSGVVLALENNFRVFIIITILFIGLFILKRRKREKSSNE
ncbi:hypothetical protein LH61_06430 [Leuconostoc mesenteroides P45]|nr:hypothetical protein LH61_06430 [Leuconostoc mesenteroides P45]